MAVIVITLQSDWSRHLMDRSTLNLLMMYLLMDLHNRKNVFLYYLQKFSPENILSVKRTPLFGDGLGNRTFLIWIRLNIFSWKICWLWNSVLQYLKHFHPEWPSCSPVSTHTSGLCRYRSVEELVHCLPCLGAAERIAWYLVAVARMLRMVGKSAF